MLNTFYNEFSVDSANCSLRFGILRPKSSDKKPHILITGVSDNTTDNQKHKTLIIPEKINGYDVKAIGTSAFSNNKYIDNIVLPDSIDSIGTYAFKNSSIKSIRLSENIEVIANNTFENCYNLAHINLPNNLKQIDIAAFKCCESLESIVLPDNLISLGIGVFHNCHKLKTIHIGANLSRIGPFGNAAFAYDCPVLEKITISPLNNIYMVQKNILYNTRDKILIKVFNNAEQKNIIIPTWVEKVSLASFDTTCLKSLTIKHVVSGIDRANINNVSNVYCAKESYIEEFFKGKGVNTLSVNKNSLSEFIDNINGNNISK